MNWVPIVFFLVEHTPEMLSTVEHIMHMVHGDNDSSSVMKNAIGDAITIGNSDHLKSVVSNCHKECLGAGCPADLVKG
jgi:hypothetical protein